MDLHMTYIQHLSYIYNDNASLFSLGLVFVAVFISCDNSAEIRETR